MTLSKSKWEEIEHLPVSVTDYLSVLYQKMNDITEIAGKRYKEAKEKYKALYDEGKVNRTFEVGDMALVLMLDPISHNRWHQ